MSKRNKSDEITALMRSIPTAPTVSDDYVASLLAAEAAKRSERMSRLGLLSHTVSSTDKFSFSLTIYMFVLCRGLQLQPLKRLIKPF